MRSKAVLAQQKPKHFVSDGPYIGSTLIRVYMVMQFTSHSFFLWSREIRTQPSIQIIYLIATLLPASLRRCLWLWLRSISWLAKKIKADNYFIHFSATRFVGVSLSFFLLFSLISLTFHCDCLFINFLQLFKSNMHVYIFAESMFDV